MVLKLSIVNQNHMQRYISLSLVTLITQFTLANESSWTTSGGEFNNNRHHKLSQVNESNIEDLEIFWVFDGNHSINGDTVQASPIFTGDKIITVSLSGELRALDPKDGKLLWSTMLPTPVGRRGITFHKTDAEPIGYIYSASGNSVYKISELDGSIVKEYKSGLSLLAPIIDQNNLFVATLNNGIKSFDLYSGEHLWSFSLKKNDVSPRIWSGFSYDRFSNTLLVVTSNPGGIVGTARGLDDYSVSMIAIDSLTGILKWQFKHIKNDLWDLDLAAPPIVVELPLSSQRAVFSASKTGEIIYLDIHTGHPIFQNSIDEIFPPSSDVKDVTSSPTQIFIRKPESISGLTIDVNNDFKHLDPENSSYVLSKLRHAKFGRYIPPSLNYDVAMYGIHGGADWHGATYNPLSNSVYVPFNKNPFILRLFYQDKNYYYIKKILITIDRGYISLKRKIDKAVFDLKLYFGIKIDNSKNDRSASVSLSKWSQSEWVEQDKPRKIANKIYPYLPGAPHNELYNRDCSSCHGNARQGDYQSELWGDGFYPPLVGISLTKKWNSVNTSEKLKHIHQNAGVNVDISEIDYQKMMKYFSSYDSKLLRDDRLDITGFWQLLLDLDGQPATIPPWGGIAKVSLDSGDLVWKKPFSSNIHKNTLGDINFGGVLSTDTDLVFASGAPDEKIFAVSGKTGNILWDYPLPFAGSSPPIIFNYLGCDILVAVATGGRFVGYIKNGDSVAAFKLSSCEFKEKPEN